MCFCNVKLWVHGWSGCLAARVCFNQRTQRALVNKVSKPALSIFNLQSSMFNLQSSIYVFKNFGPTDIGAIWNPFFFRFRRSMSWRLKNEILKIDENTSHREVRQKMYFLTKNSCDNWFSQLFFDWKKLFFSYFSGSGIGVNLQSFNLQSSIYKIDQASTVGNYFLLLGWGIKRQKNM